MELFVENQAEIAEVSIVITVVEEHLHNDGDIRYLTRAL